MNFFATGGRFYHTLRCLDGSAQPIMFTPIVHRTHDFIGVIVGSNILMYPCRSNIGEGSRPLMCPVTYRHTGLCVGYTGFDVIQGCCTSRVE